MGDEKKPEKKPDELNEDELGNVSGGAGVLGFGVEREMKESGERGGTEDINIGVGELQGAALKKLQGLK